MSNRLAQATSPYLLQHAENPVDWHEWGQEALGIACAEDRPILLSIGYSACHWCHVMERESFENDATAEVMNAHFVNIKVDREERPDLDDIYMQATITMNRGQGGWPMTVFLTPDQQPFFAGTYFPPEDRHGRPGFVTLLKRIAELWQHERAGLLAQAAELTEALRADAAAADPAQVDTDAAFDYAEKEFAQGYDPYDGGFGPAPKFPPTGGLDLLLRRNHRQANERAVEMVSTTLDHMARGGIYDHLAGGFCRYSTDARWLVPHFEKMLYDNALLTRSYLDGWQVTGVPAFRRVATEVLDYVIEEMTDPDGGLYSSTDADSEGEEGRFFVWQPDEVHEVVGDDGPLLCRYFDIQEGGNWEGASIPNVRLPAPTVAKLFELTPEDALRSIEAGRRKLYERRLTRIKPGLDDKVLAAWNGLMIGAFAEGYRVLRDPRYLHAAQGAATFLAEHLVVDDRLRRAHRAGQAKHAAVLEDHAYLSAGLLDLYEAGGGQRWLEWATELSQRVIDDFAADGGGFHSTPTGHEPLIVRRRNGQDGATPAPNAVIALTLARLSYHLDRPAWRDVARQAIEAHGGPLRRFPRAFPRSLAVLDFLQRGPVELAVVGDDAEPLWAEIARIHLPNRVIAASSDGASEHPLLRGKTPADAGAALYVCRAYACQAPVTDPAAVAAALR